MEVIDIDDDFRTSIIVGSAEPVEVIDTINETIEVLQDFDQDTVVVEVTQGLPGVQNLHVGYAPPSNPQEGWVWIDFNG